MELYQVRAFLAVAEELHFGRAAERLHMAQPPLSRMIKSLERELGARLFDRTTRSVRLTAAGDALVAPARAVLESIETAERAVRSAGRGETGRVRIGFAGASSHLLIAALGQLVRERHPGIELVLRSNTYSHAALRGVIDGTLDLSIARWRTRPEGIAYRAVAEEHFVLVVPTGHRLAGQRRVAMADCRDELFVTLPHDPGSRARDVLMELAATAGFAPMIVQTAPDTWTSLALVAAGVGIALTYDTAVANVVQTGIAMIPLEEGRDPTYQYLAWRADDGNPALAAVLSASEVALPTPELPAGD